MLEQLKVAGFSVMYLSGYCIVDSNNQIIIKLNSLETLIKTAPSFLESEGVY
jgi:hypothetical protein